MQLKSTDAESPGLAPPPDLGELLDAARKETGLDDFGDGFSGTNFHEGLAKLLETTTELPYSQQGLMGFKANIHRQLVNRLRFHRDLKAHPEILDEDVSDPILVLGMPRTGTTKLSRMLSADPNAQAQKMWRLLNPAPFQNAKPGAPDPRIEVACKVVAAMEATNPDFFVTHSYSAEEPDEDGYLHTMIYAHVNCWLPNPAPRYLNYLRSLPRTPSFLYARALLQYLQWQDGGRRGRRWIAKNPVTIGSIDNMLQAHPKATFALCRRDLVEVIPSMCRMFETIFQQMYTAVDPVKLGRDALEFWPVEFRRLAESRKRLAGKLNLIEIHYQRIVKESITVIEEIYDRAGMKLSDAGRCAMLDWERNNPPEKHGKNTYTLERYGLTRKMVEDAFGISDIAS